MPIYNMICTNEECDYKNNNYWCKISEKENQLCPECDSLLKSVISSSNFIINGPCYKNGWTEK